MRCHDALPLRRWAHTIIPPNGITPLAFKSWQPPRSSVNPNTALKLMNWGRKVTRLLLPQDFHSGTEIQGHALIASRCPEEIKGHLRRHWEGQNDWLGRTRASRALGRELQPPKQGSRFPAGAELLRAPSVIGGQALDETSCTERAEKTHQTREGNTKIKTSLF